MNKQQVEKHLEEMRKLGYEGQACSEYFNKLKVREQRDFSIEMWNKSTNVLQKVLAEWEKSSKKWYEMCQESRNVAYWLGFFTGGATFSLLILILKLII